MPFKPGEIEGAFDAQHKALDAKYTWIYAKMLVGPLLALFAVSEGFGVMNDLADGKIDYGEELLWGLVATVGIPGGLYLLSNMMIARAEPAVEKTTNDLRGVLSRGTGLDL